MGVGVERLLIPVPHGSLVVHVNLHKLRCQSSAKPVRGADEFDTGIQIEVTSTS